MSRALVDRASALLERRTGRRGFLVKSAIVGSAVVAAPGRFLLEKNSAEAAVCTCSGDSCSCGAQCCDGYTEFCCTIYGKNACPPGALVAGWWKADGSGFCDVGSTAKPRYYMDCNAPCHGCSCGSAGLCSSACYSECGCGCANNNCGNRKACCTKFRYGQCNQHVACVGAIMCRVVTCTPPWQVDASCTHSVATDNATRFHNRACLHSVFRSRLARREPDSPTWRVANKLGSDFGTLTADSFFQFGEASDVPFFGDWNGDGTKTPGVFRDGTWYLRNSNTTGGPDITLKFGAAGDIPIVGDWNGDGKDGVGVVRGNRFLLRSSLSTGPYEHAFTMGVLPGDIPVVGDWNGDGKDTCGVFRLGQWRLKRANVDGPADVVFNFGQPGDKPVVGDWDGNGKSSPGVVRGKQWRLRYTNSAGTADFVTTFGQADQIPLVWGYPS